MSCICVCFCRDTAFFYVNYPEFLLPLDKKYIYFSIYECWLVFLEHLAAAGYIFGHDGFFGDKVSGIFDDNSFETTDERLHILDI